MDVQGKKCSDLIARAEQTHIKLITGIVHPTSEEALLGAYEAAKSGLIEPIFIAPMYKLNPLAKSLNIDLSPYCCIDVEHSNAAADMAVAMVRKYELQALMKGSIHTDELIHAVLDTQTGIRTDRRLSHCYVMDVPTYSRLLMITDAAINIAPHLEEKRWIVQNAIDLAHALGIAQPKVAILAAVETVTSTMPATVDAAALCKMAERGQITGALIDGPLAFDNAISALAAKIKNIHSDISGQPDILVAPDLEAANIMAKQLIYLAGAVAGGLVLGAKVPIILTSRADDALSRATSCALAVLFTAAQQKTGA